MHHVLSLRARALGMIAAWSAFASPALGQNQPPSAPVITEPQIDRIVNPDDVHMETAPFSDPNPGDTHLCTDWEIWRVSPLERAWITSCIGGVERLHTHLGDGVFENAHTGRRGLFPETAYELRVRFRDSSGIPATEWSPYTVRAFTTGTLAQVFPMEVQDVLNVPAPTLRETASGIPAALGNGSPPPSITISAFGVGSVLTFMGSPTGTVTGNPAALADHGDVRIDVSAGSTALALPETDIAYTDDDGTATEIYLPAISLDPGQTRSFWVASNGSTYLAMADQTAPDFSMLARGAPTPWTTAADFRAEIVATGFQLPVNIDFVPNPGPDHHDPIYYVTELYGQIKVVLRDGHVEDYATGLLNFNPTGNFPGSGEQGLADLAIDPVNGDLYITVLYSAVPGVEAAPHYPAVERLTSNDGGVTMATRTRILSMAPEQQGQSHQISNITFGPDGFLYVHVGDGFDAGSAQNLSRYRGKILRMDRNGQPVPSNPFYNASNGITATDYIYASGVRNPFGGAWRTSDAAHYFVENGPSVDRFARLVAGRNYLWDGSDASMFNFALYNWNPATAPVNIAFLENTVFARSGFPVAYEGRAYVTQSGGTYGIGPGNAQYKVVTEWVIDASGVLQQGPRPVAFYNGGGASSAVAIAAGPDGLYFSDFYAENETSNPIARGSNILRLSYRQPPPPPDCNNNSIPDADDFAAGTSLDCNLNFIPDECDIAAGRSTDCDNDSIPDECQGLIPTTTTFAGNNPGPFTVNSPAAIVNSAARLTTTAGGVWGSIVSTQPTAAPVSRFLAAFDFRIGNGSGADGMSFSIFDAALYPATHRFGEEGAGVDPLPEPAPGPPRALTVQFDTFDNGGEGENSIEVMYDGLTIARVAPPFSIEDFTWRRADILFDGQHISIGITPPGGPRVAILSRLEVPGYIPRTARYGFGARTGGLTNEHWVDNVSIAFGDPLDNNGNGITDLCECEGDANHNGGVGFDDIAEVLANFGGIYPPGSMANGDANFDLMVNFLDVAVVLSNFGRSCP